MTNGTEPMVTLPYAHLSQQFTKYAGVCLYSICLFGTFLNILTFTRHTYHKRACSLYLLVASICDFIHLNLGPLSNILQYGFQYDWTITSLIYCKAKSYFVFVFTVMSATLTAIASIDRYFLSSKKTQRWRFNTRVIAVRCIVFAVCFWSVASVPIAFCYTRFSHSSDNEELTCTNPCRSKFCFWIQIVCTCIFNGYLPPLVMIYFGVLTCSNTRHLNRRVLGRSPRIRQINCQMTSMLVLQSLKSSFTSLPFTVFNCYFLITLNSPKSLLYQAKENLAHQIVYLLFWSNYTSFFVYVYSSDIFRKQCLRAIKRIICCYRSQRDIWMTKTSIDVNICQCIRNKCRQEKSLSWTETRTFQSDEHAEEFASIDLSRRNMNKDVDEMGALIQHMKYM